MKQRRGERFLAWEHPDNNAIPDAAKEDYLYAGEAGRRRNYAQDLCQPNGWYRQQIVDAVRDVRIELPFIHFRWQAEGSALNEFSEFTLPSPSLIQRLGLASKNREIDFYETMDERRPGTLYRESGNGCPGNRYRLLYVRADLLRRYLTATHQVLAWCNWGKRDWLKKRDDVSFMDNPSRQRICQDNRYIHRSFSLWSAKDFNII
ncbi:hypothetical protein [Methylacidimicrobium sp. B4]|uniref:hypothetical protein n=1 Tax=Methylacidimicrobium sp. B4 TaxID=2796139 RepID=UPI001A9068A9|nr:hypothetical protein [Methylacidimicrobium sp. B4]QSR84803.1 hypothetical protein MacB4_00500 [Methylacidimicrobium sp. B4]